MSTAVETQTNISPTAESALPTVARMPERIPGERPTRGVPFGRLLRVEARKMFDTKAGRWLLILVGVLIAAILTIMFFFVENGNHSFEDYLGGVAPLLAYLLPVVGIMGVTAEFSQRTGLVTYGLEPRRSRVTWAKTFVAWGLAVAAFVLSLALAAVAHFAAIHLRDADTNWSTTANVLVGIAFYLVILTSWGVALGMALRNTAAAIVLFFLVPMAWSILGGLVPALETPAKWLDMNRTLAPLFEGSLTGEQWAQVGTSVSVWVVLPLLVGMIMLNRAEVK